MYAKKKNAASEIRCLVIVTLTSRVGAVPRPDRTIRVVLWANEELGARGAIQYRETHLVCGVCGWYVCVGGMDGMCVLCVWCVGYVCGVCGVCTPGIFLPYVLILLFSSTWMQMRISACE